MTEPSPAPLPLAAEPGPDCGLCPRLADFRRQNREAYPDFFNRPVPAFGALEAKFLIVGLAPGLRGANRTGRPFTGDGAGLMLYPALLRFDLARGSYLQEPDDGLELLQTRITNSVRCVPPGNKPLPAEIRACSDYLRRELAAMPNLRTILALGRVAHDAVLRGLNLPLKAHPFVHGARHQLNGAALFDSYHCSRYNVNTGVLTQAMFDDLMGRIAAELKG